MMRPPMSRPGSERAYDPVQHDGASPVHLAGGLHRVRTHEFAGARDIGDVAALDQPLQSLVQAADDVVLVLVDRRHVDALQSRLDAERLALAGRVGDLRSVQEGLCRDASPMQTGAAEFVLFDQDDALAQLGGT